MTDERNPWPAPGAEGAKISSAEPAPRSPASVLGPAANSAAPWLPIEAPTAAQRNTIPEDLRVPWTWIDLGLFLVFALASLLALELAFALFAIVRLHVDLAELRQLAMTNAKFIVIRQGLWFGALMLYLFLAIRRRDGRSFWSPIGWRPLRPRAMTPGAAVVVLLIGGVGLAFAISIAAKLIGTKVKPPIEGLLQDRQSVLLVMLMAILAAPVVEETIFRGFLYPVVARRFGPFVGVLVTGALFGSLHAGQLWGAWGIVGLIVFVGILLSYIRARTGTVLASFLVHLSYNTTLFLGTYLATDGLRRFPPGP